MRKRALLVGLKTAEVSLTRRSCQRCQSEPSSMKVQASQTSLARREIKARFTRRKATTRI
eukprot:3557678-Pleurochrysis_carterae.AAC.1